MLDEHELVIWYGRLGLSEPAQSLIRHIRSSAPTRRVGGGQSNVWGRYPSRKMGLTIQFESRRVELPAIHEMEHDPDLFEFYDQPPAIKLVFECADGKRRGFLHTPDFFVLRRDSAGWEEWKTEERLRQLSAHNPKRFVQEGGYWRSPAAETYARQFRLAYGSGPRMRSTGHSREISSFWMTTFVPIPGAPPQLRVRMCWLTFPPVPVYARRSSPRDARPSRVSMTSIF